MDRVTKMNAIGTMFVILIPRNVEKGIKNQLWQLFLKLPAENVLIKNTFSRCPSKKLLGQANNMIRGGLALFFD